MVLSGGRGTRNHDSPKKEQLKFHLIEFVKPSRWASTFAFPTPPSRGRQSLITSPNRRGRRLMTRFSRASHEASVAGQFSLLSVKSKITEAWTFTPAREKTADKILLPSKVNRVAICLAALAWCTLAPCPCCPPPLQKPTPSLAAHPLHTFH